jgi:hypothetical protein
MNQCKFCTKTADRATVMFKGLLNTYICDSCVKYMFLLMGRDMIRRMDFRALPLRDWDNQNIQPDTWLQEKEK